ncbi:MAG: ComF family protein [Lachnospiraceae bacterium]|nr:ComF family protein [Lachnospiraceae bacterium]
MNGFSVADILFPARCPICHDAVYPRKRLVCDECKNLPHYVSGPVCLKCGRGLSDPGEEYCYDCSRIKHEFEAGRAVFVYDEMIKKSIYSFKYGNRREYAAYYGREMAARLGEFIKRTDPDAIIPIPLNKKRYKKRGYNQAELIAKELSKHVNIPVMTDVLIREKNTRVQKNLSASERQNNLKNAFKIGRNDVSLKTVIIVDDIFTTGSTIDSAARCLHENGVAGVYFSVLSIADMS